MTCIRRVQLAATTSVMAGLLALAPLSSANATSGARFLALPSDGWTSGPSLAARFQGTLHVSVSKQGACAWLGKSEIPRSGRKASELERERTR